jgi:hypothetical protein
MNLNTMRSVFRKLGKQLEEVFDAKWKELPGGDQEGAPGHQTRDNIS